MERRYFYAPPLIQLIGYWCASCGVSLYFGHIQLFVIEFIVYIVLWVKNDGIHVPYVSTLHISDTEIERRVFGVSHTTLSREAVNVEYLMIRDTRYVVFSLDKLEHYWGGSVAALARTHRAIMYPLTERMRADFPELFDCH